VRIKRVLLVGLILGAIGLAWRAQGATVFGPDYWLAFVKFHPVASPALFIPIYAAAMLCFVPTLPLNMVAGAVWGPAFGSGLALAGSVSGAMLAFVLARAALGRPFAKQFDRQRLAWLQGEFARHGWKVMAFVRLNPLFPGPVNFLFGLTSMNLWTYFWSTTLFLIPLTVTFAIFGSSVGAMLLDRSVTNLRNTLLVGGASLLFLALCALALRARYSMRAEQPDL
jgi:uncharacterized membrane protein YdjX (TVP38/TMEM64 family)